MFVQFFVQNVVHFLSKLCPFFVPNFVQHFCPNLLGGWGTPGGAPLQLGGTPGGAPSWGVPLGRPLQLGRYPWGRPPSWGVPPGAPQLGGTPRAPRPSWGVPLGRPPSWGGTPGAPPKLGVPPGAPPSWGGTPGAPPPVEGVPPGAPPCEQTNSFLSPYDYRPHTEYDGKVMFSVCLFTGGVPPGVIIWGKKTVSPLLEFYFPILYLRWQLGISGCPARNKMKQKIKRKKRTHIVTLFGAWKVNSLTWRKGACNKWSITQFTPDISLLFSGFVTYLAMEHGVFIPPDPFWYCTVSMTVLFSAFLCSTLFIMSMTFGRFYSVIRPHKAASFNTVKRAKFTIFVIILCSLLYNIPHLFISDNNNWECLPYGRAMGKPYGEFYYWLSFVVNFAVPFVLLLSMNSVIIHKIRIRPITSNAKQKSHTRSKLKIFKPKTSDSQMFAILLLVTFGFLILTTPAYIVFPLCNDDQFLLFATTFRWLFPIL